MTKPELIYTTYIQTTPAKLWEAITNPEFTRQYWAGHDNVSDDWKPGSKWSHISNDSERSVYVVGKVVESVPPKRLVLTWAEPGNEADVSRVTFEIEPLEDVVRLNVIHGEFKPGSDMINKVSGGWPRVLSSLKSFLETGKSLNIWTGNSCNSAQSETKEPVVAS
ncbi:MAG: ArsR family transcriptional regulator [Verrucomicrobiales bacterium]|nr:ArsR family transcriptional regulator [Verrucomicrobiales bacterium]